jgi:hypothetical protein
LIDQHPTATGGTLVGAAPAIELAPGVWRVPTAPQDLINSYVFVDQDGQVTLVTVA